MIARLLYIGAERVVALITTPFFDTRAPQSRRTDIHSCVTVGGVSA